MLKFTTIGPDGLVTELADDDIGIRSFEGAGPFRVVNSLVGRVFNDTGRNLEITAVKLYRRLAGDAGTTEVDVQVDGSSIYSTAANRPKVLFSAGNDAVNAGGAIASPTWASGSYLEVEITQAETGPRRDLTVSIATR